MRQPKKSKANNLLPRLEQLESREVPSISISASVNWNEVGPQTIANGQSTNIAGSNPVNGAISALAAHPTNPNILYAAAPNGGVWRTFNAQSASPTWEPISDRLSSLSVSDIALDPTNPRRLLIGIGQTADGTAEDRAKDPTRNGLRGDLVGAFITEDAEAPIPTWRQITSNIVNRDVTKVLLRSGSMIIGTTTGMFYSSNGGLTFTNTFAVTRDNGNTFNNEQFTGRVFDIASNPRLPTQIYMAAVGASGLPDVFRSDNGGQTWGVVTDSTQMQFNARTVNVQLSVRDVGEVENQVYVAVSNNNPVQQSSEDHLVTPPGVDLTYLDPWRGTVENATFNYTNRLGEIASVCWSTNQGGTWTRMDTPKQQMAPLPIDRIYVENGRLVIEQDPVVSLFMGRAISPMTRLRTGDVVRIEGLIDTNDPPNPVVFSDYFVEVINDYKFALVGETYAPGIAYVPSDANPPFPDIPLTPATYRRLTNASPGEKSQFLNIIADPSQEQTVYIGGDYNIRDFYATAAQGPTTYTDTLWRGNRFTSAGGSNKRQSKQWTTMTETGNTAQNAPAGDTRDMVFDASGNLWLATGGGIYRKSNPSTTTPWTNVNGNIRVGQFWSGNLSTNSGTIFGGTQDTGAVAQLVGGNPTYTGLNNTTFRNRLFDQESSYSTDVDNVTTPGVSVQYFAGKDFQNIIRRTVNASGTQTSLTRLQFASPATTTVPFSGLLARELHEGVTDANPDNDPLNEALTIQIKLNLNDRRRAVYGRTQVYEDADPAGVTGATVNNVTPTGMTGNVTGFMYGGIRNGVRFNQVLYVGTSTGQLWVRGEFGTSFANRAPAGPGAITDIVRNEDDWRNVYILKGGRVFESFDAGLNWTDITSNLTGGVDPTTGGPAAGFLSTEIRTLTLWDPEAGNTAGGVVLLAGGRGGVYRQVSNAGCTVGWGRYGNGMPNSIVTDLTINGDQLLASTFGRGTWYIGDVRPTLITPITATVTGTAGADKMSISADPTNPNNFIVSDGVNAMSLAYGDVSTVVFNGLGGADTVLVDSNGYAPGGDSRFMRISITANLGGDLDDELIVNNETDTTNEVVTITGTTIGGFAGDTFFNAGCGQISYTGLENGTLYVNTGLNNDRVNISSATAKRNVVYSSGGNDDYVMPTSLTGRIDLVDSVGTNRLFISGLPSDDIFTAVNTGISFNGTTDVNFFGNIQNILIDGAGGANTITAVGGTTQTNFVVNHTGGYTGTATGLRPILNFSNVQNFGAVGNSSSDTLRWQDRTSNRYGSATNPELGSIYIPTAATSGRLITAQGSVTTLSFNNLFGAFSVNGDAAGTGSRDTITVLGTTSDGLPSQFGELSSPDAIDTITASDTSVSVNNAFYGALKPVQFETSSTSAHSYLNIFVRGGDEVGNIGDRFIATPTLRTNLMLDGGNPGPRTNPGDTITVNYTGSRTITSVGAGSQGPAHNRFTLTATNASLGYFNFEADPPVPGVTPPPPPGPGEPPPVPPLPTSKSQLFAVGTEAGVVANVKVYNSSNGSLRFNLTPFGNFTGGVRVATGDVNGDGVQDIAVTAGVGGGPRVIVYNGATGAVLRDFQTYTNAENMNKGQYIAIGDINADGFGDIITSTGPGRSSLVKAYSGQSNALLRQFQPYAAGFTGGVRLAAGDVDGDGYADIVTGAGPGGGPHVQAFSGKTNAVVQSFFAYVQSFSVGIYVAAGDVDGDGKADIITGPEVTGGAHVQVFQGGTSVPIRGFFVGEPTVPNQQPITVGSGARVAAHDIDGDGVVEILTGRGRGVKPLAQMIKVSNRNTTTGVVTPVLTTPLVVNPFGDGYLDGIFVG